MTSKVIIAGGGTGGHLFSGIALAEEFSQRGYQVIFVGTKRGLESKLLPQYNYPLITLPVSSLKGRALLERLKTFLILPLAMIKSFWICLSKRPKAVIGIGGYASGPTLMVSSFLGLKTAVIDQNSIPGFTNRILSRFVKKVYLSFDASKTYFKNQKKLKVTGNPIPKARHPKDSIEFKPSILVCGGSQGAQKINEVFLDILAQLKESFSELEVIHQTGAFDFQRVKKIYEKKKIELKSLRVEDFINNMEDVYPKVSLMIARAGAGTLTEMALWGIPSILIPYPYAADNHQKANAKVFSDKDAAILIDQKDLSPERLLKEIVSILKDQNRWNLMKERTLALANFNAAKDIADDLGL